MQRVKLSARPRSVSPLNRGGAAPSCGQMTQPRGASLAYVILPAGPADAEALALVHVTAWRETYRGLLPDAFLARMSEPGHVSRFRRELTRPGPDDVVL